ncbi:MAG: DUF5320 domain-containing protein [Thermoflexales bacterium]|nr:DUF5320 domain-containing protein [Thermoflexales bacterium]
MPAGDRTGPMGMGPRTGRAAGYCAGSDAPGYANPIPGRDFWGRGWWWRGRWPRWGGWGRGWRHWYYATGLPRWARRGCPPACWGSPAPPTREEEIEVLREEAEWLKEQLEAVNQRLADLEKAAGEPGR